MMNEDLVTKGFTIVLQGLGADLENENFRETPYRITKAYKEVLRNQNKSPDEIAAPILNKIFPSPYKGLVAVQPIQAISICPHHFFLIDYKVDVGYIGPKTVGLSKLPRVVVELAARAELQETFTQDIVNVIEKFLEATGVMVVVYGKHGCMSHRGIKQNGAITITSSVKGIFEKDLGARQEFLLLIKNTR